MILGTEYIGTCAMAFHGAFLSGIVAFLFIKPSERPRALAMGYLTSALSPKRALIAIRPDQCQLSIFPQAPLSQTTYQYEVHTNAHRAYMNDAT